MSRKKIETNNETVQTDTLEETSLLDCEMTFLNKEMSFNEIEVDTRGDQSESKSVETGKGDDEDGFVCDRRRRSRIQRCILSQISKRIQTLEKRTGLVSCLVYLRNDEMVVEGNRTVADVLKMDETFKDSFKDAEESIASRKTKPNKQPGLTYGSLDISPPKKEKLTVAFLRKLLTKAVSTSIGYGTGYPRWGNQQCRPQWWPVEIPFLSPASGTCGLRKGHLLQIYDSLKTFLKAQQNQASSVDKGNINLPNSQQSSIYSDHNYHTEQSEATTQTENEQTIYPTNQSLDLNDYDMITNNQSEETFQLQPHPSTNDDIIVILDENQSIVIDTNGNSTHPATSLDSNQSTIVDSHLPTDVNTHPHTIMDSHSVTDIKSKVPTGVINQSITIVDSELPTDVDTHPATTMDSELSSNANNQSITIADSELPMDVTSQAIHIIKKQTSIIASPL